MVYDLIVLGGGPAGYLAAERAGHGGMKVLCLEGRSFGGVCLNEGCIPTKTLLYSAKLADGAGHGEKYGVFADGVRIDHKKVVARKNKVVAALVLLSFALSFACGRLPLVSSLSSGTRTILLTVALSAGAALLFPVKDAEKEGNAP